MIGVGVGTGIKEYAMNTMFGTDGYLMTDAANLVADLVRVYEDQLDIGYRPPGY